MSISSSNKPSLKRQLLNVTSQLADVKEEDDQDLSSQEEDLVKRSKQIKRSQQVMTQSTRANNTATSRGPDPTDLAGLANMKILPVDELPVLKPIQELVRDHAHMRFDPSTNTPACVNMYNKFINDHRARGNQIALEPQPAAAIVELTDASVSQKTAREIEQEHAAQAELNPWQFAAFNEWVEKLTVPTYFLRDNGSSDMQRMLTQDELNHMLRVKQLSLPQQKSDLESALLGEAGLFVDPSNGKPYVYPACRRADQCIGMQLAGKIRGLNQPILMMSVMFSEDYQKFMETGEPPLCTLPCVLCCRSILCDLTQFLRHNKMIGSSTGVVTNGKFEWRSEQVLQLYGNLRDQPGGYDSSHMVKPGLQEPIVEPLVELNTSLLECRRTRFGRRMIDQSGIVWKPPISNMPRVGESLSHF